MKAFEGYKAERSKRGSFQLPAGPYVGLKAKDSNKAWFCCLTLLKANTPDTMPNASSGKMQRIRTRRAVIQQSTKDGCGSMFRVQTADAKIFMNPIFGTSMTQWPVSRTAIPDISGIGMKKG